MELYHNVEQEEPTSPAGIKKLATHPVGGAFQGRGRGRVNLPPGLEDWEDWRVGSLVVGSTRHEAQGLGGL